MIRPSDHCMHGNCLSEASTGCWIIKEPAAHGHRRNVLANQAFENLQRGILAKLVEYVGAWVPEASVHDLFHDDVVVPFQQHGKLLPVTMPGMVICVPELMLADVTELHFLLNQSPTQANVACRLLHALRSFCNISQSPARLRLLHERTTSIAPAQGSSVASFNAKHMYSSSSFQSHTQHAFAGLWAHIGSIGSHSSFSSKA